MDGRGTEDDDTRERHTDTQTHKTLAVWVDARPAGDDGTFVGASATQVRAKKREKRNKKKGTGPV